MQSSIGLHGAMVTRSFASFNIVLLAAAVGNQWRENALQQEKSSNKQ